MRFLLKVGPHPPERSLSRRRLQSEGVVVACERVVALLRLKACTTLKEIAIGNRRFRRRSREELPSCLAISWWGGVRIDVFQSREGA